MIFKKFSKEAASELLPFYGKCSYIMSDFSLGLKLMWSDALNPEYSISDGVLFVRNNIKGKISFDYPIFLSDDADESAALAELSEYCRENFIPLVISNVPSEKIPLVTSLSRGYELIPSRKYADYVYDLAEMAKMSGRKYSGQRNHINKFESMYPDSVFTEFTKDDISKINEFICYIAEKNGYISDDAKYELQLSLKMLDMIDEGSFVCGGYTLDGKILSFCMSERRGNTLIDHIEKADTDYEGIYPATVRAFLRSFGEGLTYFNREDDSGSRGLRMSKLQYKPCMILEKNRVILKNELFSLNEVPELVSKRLTYGAIDEADIERYNELCLDDELNRYWGYDYRTDCPEPDEYYFYLDQKKDFDNRCSVNFAIRRDENLIGEAILYNFDGFGGCEIGIRLLPKYGRRGYGREALSALTEYALYSLGMSCVRAKCHKENAASKKMLSSVMQKDGEDEAYYKFVSYF